jgi:hypothetical protein
MPVEIFFPTARVDRSEPIATSTAAAATPALPNVKLWPFAMEQTSPGDRNATSPFLSGPAVIDSLFLQWDDDNTTPRPTITVNYGPALLSSGLNPGLPTAAFGTQMFTDGVITTATANTYQGTVMHLPKWAGVAGTVRLQYDLRYPINLERFQIMVRMGTQTAGPHVVVGYARILENVPPEILLNFL